MKAKRNHQQGESDVDWDAYNEHLLERIGAEASRIGVISGIVDLGTHENEPSMFDYVGDDKQKKLLEDEYNRGNRVEDVDGKKMLILPQKPSQQFAVIADFPEIMIDYGQFFGENKESEEKPYRHILNGEWYLQHEKMKTVNLRFPAVAKKNKDDKWTFGENSYIGKLAKAGGVTDEVMTEEMDIGGLMETIIMFQLGAEKNPKGYVNMKCKQPSSKHEAIPVPEWNANPCFISFDGENDEGSLRELNASIRNTMAMSPDFGESEVRKELEALGLSFDKFKTYWTTEDAPAAKDNSDQEPASQEPPETGGDDGDDEIPF